MDCVEQIKFWFYIVLALIGLILFLVAMFMNYNLKLSADQKKMKIKLENQSKEIQEVERVNGKEKKDIKEIYGRVEFLEGKLREYEKKKII